MLDLLVVDPSSAVRSRLAEEIVAHLSNLSTHFSIAQHVQVLPLPPEEVAFHPDPFLIVAEAHTLLAHRQLAAGFSSAQAIAVHLPAEDESPQTIEKLLRLGASDTFSGPVPLSLIMKHLTRAVEGGNKLASGDIVLVDSGKGGVGSTSLTVGIAHLLAECGLKVGVVDCALTTRDLSRFLWVRPHINESLSGLLTGANPVLSSTVKDCFLPVPWHSEIRVAPPPAQATMLISSPRSLDNYISFLRCAAHLFSMLIVDAARVSEVIATRLIEVAHRTIFVIDNDPASLPASAERLRSLMPFASHKNTVTLVSNSARSYGAGVRGTRLAEELWRHVAGTTDGPPVIEIPHLRRAARWPGTEGHLLESLPTATAQRLVEACAPAILSSELARREQPSRIGRIINLVSQQIGFYLRSDRPALPPGSISEENSKLNELDQLTHRSCNVLTLPDHNTAGVGALSAQASFRNGSCEVPLVRKGGLQRESVPP